MTQRLFSLDDYQPEVEQVEMMPDRQVNQPEAHELRDYQQAAIDNLRQSLLAGHRRPVLQLPTGGGKCLGIGTMVLKFSGELIPVECIIPGDVLMGPDSLPRTVISTAKGVGPLYRIVPTKGESWVCNDVHVLTLVETVSGEIVDIPLNEYHKKNKTFKHCHKQFQPEYGVDFVRKADPIIDGYFIGLWIGDGTKSLKMVEISKPDIEVLMACNDMAIRWGCQISTSFGTGNCPTYRLVTPKGQRNQLLEAMRLLFSEDGIPHSITTSSRQYRLNVMAGLIDSDGYNHNNCIEIAQKNKKTAEGIMFIARSLGFKITNVEKIVNGVVYQRMMISGDLSVIPNRIPRKICTKRQQKKRSNRTGFNVIPIGHGEYAGFELSGDGRFLLGDYTVTHNTAVAGAIIGMARNKGSRVVFTIPALSLIDQTLRSFWRDGIRDVGVIQADHPLTAAWKPVQIASLETLKNREFPDCQMVIVDECHRKSEHLEKWMKLSEWQKVPFIGLSATPWAKGMAKHWNDLIIGGTTASMIEAGYLTPYRVFATGHPDLSGVKIVAGEYQEKSLAEAMDKPTLVGDVVQTWIDRGENRPTLVFGVDCAHAKHLQDRFLDRGIRAAYVDAKTSREEREEIGKGLQAGKYQVVCNIRTLTTGVDLDVRCIVLAMATKSEILYTQIIGRGLRTAEGKEDLIILDHGGTCLELGFVSDIHHDCLDDGKPKAKAEKKKPLPKECPECACLMPPKTLTCPMCGHVRKPPQNSVTAGKGELVEITPGKRRGKGTKEGGPKNHVWIGDGWIPLEDFYGQLAELAAERGYNPHWVSHKFKEAAGCWPNAWRGPRKTVSMQVRNWVKHQNIKWAKSKSNPANQV